MQPERVGQVGEGRALDGQQADYADDGESANVRIAQYLQTALTGEAAEQCIATVHETVQVQRPGQRHQGHHHQYAGQQQVGGRDSDKHIFRQDMQLPQEQQVETCD